MKDSNRNLPYDVCIADDINHEMLFAEILYLDRHVCVLSQELGLDNLIIEFPSSSCNFEYIARSIPLDVLLQAIDSAKRELYRFSSKRT